MFPQVELGFGRIPLELERHPRTLHHGKSWVHRHNAKAEQPRPASLASGSEDLSQADC